jgi:hypothetical protein
LALLEVLGRCVADARAMLRAERRRDTGYFQQLD